MKKMFFAIMLILRPLGYRRMPIRRERLCEEQMRDRRTYKTSDRGIHTSSGRGRQAQRMPHDSDDAPWTCEALEMAGQGDG